MKSFGGNIVTLDPTLFTDSITGRTVVSQLSGTTSLSEFTDNDGASYSSSGPMFQPFRDIGISKSFSGFSPLFIGARVPTDGVGCRCFKLK